MAKGWESKAVESQVQDAEPKNGGKKRGSKLTASESETKRRLEVLVLSRSRVAKDLEASQNERYKAHLTRALADIEAQISALQELVGGNS
jgi:hypothetical protein